MLRREIQQKFNNFAVKFFPPASNGVEENAKQRPSFNGVEEPVKQAPPFHEVVEH